MRSIGKGIFNAEARNKENRKRLERTQPASNFIRGRVKKIERVKRKKKIRGREKRKGKHEFPNISSKCEVYCEKYTILDI